MRILIILVLVVVALALLRALARDVIKAVSKSLGAGEDADEDDVRRPARDNGERAPGGSRRSAGRLVKDPVSGTFVDEATAVKDNIGGQTYYFESAENRDAFRRRERG